MLSGQVPFQSSRSFRSSDFIMQRITQGDIRFEGQQWESISPAAKDLIKGVIYKVDSDQHKFAFAWKKFPEVCTHYKLVRFHLGLGSRTI